MVVTFSTRSDFGMFQIMALFIGVQASFRKPTVKIPKKCLYREGTNSHGIKVVTENPIPNERKCQIYWENEPLLQEPIGVQYALRVYYALTEERVQLGYSRGEPRNFRLTSTAKVLQMLQQKQLTPGVCILCEGMQFKKQRGYPACEFCCGTGDNWDLKTVKQDSMDSDVCSQRQVIAQVSPRRPRKGESPLVRNDSGEIVGLDARVVCHSQVKPGMTVTHCGSYQPSSNPECPTDDIDELPAPFTNPTTKVLAAQPSQSPVVEVPSIERPRSERQPSTLVPPKSIEEKKNEVGLDVLISDAPSVESDGTDKIEKLCLTLSTKKLMRELAEQSQKDDLLEEPKSQNLKESAHSHEPKSEQKDCRPEFPDLFFHSVHPDHDRDFMCQACERDYCDGQCSIATRLERAVAAHDRNLCHSVHPKDKDFLCEECENVLCCGGCERQTKSFVHNHALSPDEHRDVLCQRCNGFWCDTTCTHELESEMPDEVKDLKTY